MATYQSQRRNRVVATLSNAMAANLAAAMLRVQGVIAVVESAAAGSGDPAGDGPPDGVRLSVAPEDEERARAVLAEKGIIV